MIALSYLYKKISDKFSSKTRIPIYVYLVNAVADCYGIFVSR